MKRAILPTLALPFLLLETVQAETKTFEMTVIAGKHDYTNTPVCVPLSVPKALATKEDVDVRVVEGGASTSIFGQMTAPGLTTEHVQASAPELVRRDLHFLIPDLKAGNSLALKLTLDSHKSLEAKKRFAWDDVKGPYTDLRFRESNSRGPVMRPVMRYMHAPYDPAKGKRELTYKVFHHLFDPEGQRYVTNGGHTDHPNDAKKMLYPHHRGLMYAFNKITYDGNKKADTWHAMPKDTHEEHVRFLQVEAGAILGRHRVLIDWRGPENDVFAQEERELTVYNVPGGTLVEFVSRLKTTDGKVKLDGDPQHAGFQFRASNDVAEKTAKQTYYLRPDGKGEPGKTRNWPGDKQHVDLPWDAMSFVLDSKRYTVAYLNKPTNPKPSRFSERDYGRFGCYFEYELTKDNPLVVDYRVWLQDGEMTGSQVQALSTSFVTPPQVTVK